MTTYQVTIGDRTVRIALRRTDSAIIASIDDGPEQSVSVATVHGLLRSLAIGSNRHELLAAPLDNHAIAIALNGLEYRADVVDEARARLAAVAGSRASAHARLELKAPMPGLVVRVLCSVGDEVSPNQPLAVLQAMKMENELALPRGGKVTALSVEQGQTVEQGQVLLTLE